MAQLQSKIAQNYRIGAFKWSANLVGSLVAGIALSFFLYERLSSFNGTWHGIDTISGILTVAVIILAFIGVVVSLPMTIIYCGKYVQQTKD